MAQLKSESVSMKLSYEMPGAEGGKNIVRTKLFANIKTALDEDAFVTFGTKIAKLQKYPATIAKIHTRKLEA